ncbi:hypothetical protein SAMN06265365_12398 [Tistlia consotensis]|uniref:Cytochrome c-552/4 domain-containing protein n=1 Tax=Tistlia consotensis USBA 355 TaxID=560819 RepID=A0A1Y6CGF7_9PROT|nr:hypothetical protein [Tistlia consotensis]SMF63899.1 hypothetical protein SAMN05428998_12511 [Tistlia consotensis USBA 355]SNR98280.1 hypothetical protein SAMN06265365_12398 [Tistlia consotensis]
MSVSSLLRVAAAVAVLLFAGVAGVRAETQPSQDLACAWPAPAQASVDAFVQHWCYDGWEKDVRVRDTGPYIAQNPLSTAPLDFGVHPAVRIYYSPNMAHWVEAGRPAGGPLQPAMLVKEMYYPPPAARYQGLTPETKRPHVSSWTVMLYAPDQVADGWYWAYAANPAWIDPTRKPDASGDATVTSAGAPSGPAGGHSAEFVARVTKQLQYPDASFGSYCTRCHSSAVDFQTFSTTENFGPHADPRSYLVVAPAAAPGQDPAFANVESLGLTTPDTSDDLPLPAAVRVPEIHAHIAEPPPPSGSPDLAEPLLKPNRLWLDTYSEIPLVPTEEVEKTAFAPETFDHRYMPPGAPPHPIQYVTSDQCIGCHDASVSAQWNPQMLYPDKVSGKLANLSVYGEWRNSMMGLAGRDPIFFAQLESERNIHKPIETFTQDLCLSCHGGMGQRQFHADNPHAPACTPDQTSKEACFTRDRLLPFSAEVDANSLGDLKYAALGREGISCALCHHMSDEGLGTPASFTGNFKPGPTGELYGPFKDVLVKPMERALEMTPKHAAHMTQGTMCGSCHAIDLPVFEGGKPVMEKDPKTGEEKQLHHFEQTTYLEWLNSEFQNEVEPVDLAGVRTCQDCHMSNVFQGNPLKMAIANIEDANYPDTDNRLPDREIDVRPRVFKRHTLLGINLFGLEMFQQFNLILGLRTVDPMVPSATKLGLATARDAGVELARRQSARVEITDLTAGRGGLEAEVKVSNLTGHKFPSGVGFRRAFVNFELEDDKGRALWASGRTNAIGVILGADGKPLKTEFFGPDQQQWEPFHRTIDSQDQVQIYELHERNARHQLTTSFLSLYETVKDTRLAPRGWRKDGPWAQVTEPCAYDRDYQGGESGHDPCRPIDEPGYTGGGGYDQVAYKVACTPALKDARKVVARVYYQAMMPSFLKARFTDAKGPDTRRLHYLGSYLSTDGTPVEDWKVLIDEVEVPLPAGALCQG